MSHAGHLVVYTTSHGYGHLNRTAAVLNQLPTEVRVTIRCDQSLFRHWGERLLRPAGLEHFVCDSGAVNPPGDSATTDGPATVALASQVFDKALGGVDDEARVLEREGATAILCDAPAVPLLAARQAGVPGLLLANFTWADIYAEHARAMGPAARSFVTRLQETYQQASLLYRAQPCLPMDGLEPRIDVGMVLTPGRDRREELCARLDLAVTSRLVYFYIGRYGQSDLGWSRLARHGEIQFVGFHPPHGEPPQNYHVIAPELFTGSELAASTDVTVAKAGYGTVCEVMVAGRPLIYPPRTGFAEHAVLEEALECWGGGIRVQPEQFLDFDLDEALETALVLKPGPPPYPVDGAARVADHVCQVCAGRIPPAPVASGDDLRARTLTA